MVRVENLSRQTMLMNRGRVADNSWTRLKGLIGVKQLSAGDGLVIKPCRGVHCMFMSVPIDVVYVDKHDRVVAVDHVMRPWSIGRIYRQSQYVVELPAGTAEKSRTMPGDQLALSQL
ncbi:MAG: DUF192 domain-containing protein [Caldilineaceae bacterium]|nr:DUF192 domain-containing protein [Caldilineaceae bacterium]